MAHLSMQLLQRSSRLEEGGVLQTKCCLRIVLILAKVEKTVRVAARMNERIAVPRESMRSTRLSSVYGGGIRVCGVEGKRRDQRTSDFEV